MKLDPDMYTVMHLVSLGKTGVTLALTPTRSPRVRWHAPSTDVNTYMQVIDVTKQAQWVADHAMPRTPRVKGSKALGVFCLPRPRYSVVVSTQHHHGGTGVRVTWRRQQG
jgi:hypothetical protein